MPRKSSQQKGLSVESRGQVLQVPNISEKIKILMIRNHKTVDDIAAALQCTRQSIYENLTNNRWKLPQLVIICDLLDCELEISMKEKYGDFKI